MENKIVSVLLIFLFTVTVVIYTESDLELAQLYMEEAFYNYEHENYPIAEKNLLKSIGFSNQLPEVWYLSGLISEGQGNRLKSLDLYKKSIDLSDAYQDYFYDLYFRYINLLNITDNHKDVLDFYSDNKAVLRNHDSIKLKISDSAYKYGLIDLSKELAFDVYRRNPDNLKALIYLIRSTDDDKYFHFIKKNIHNLIKDKMDEVLFQELILNATQMKRKYILDLYDELFGDTPFYYTQIEEFSDSINKSHNLLVRSYGSDILSDGVYFADYNFDNISDEIISVSGNELTYLKDNNQDNITDLSINYVDKIPVNIFLNKGMISYEFKYSEYPYVEEIHYNNQSLKRVYKIFPGTEFTPLGDLSIFSWKYNSNRESVLDDFDLNPEDILQMSYAFLEYLPVSDFLFREYLLVDGEIKGIKEDSLLNGSFDHYMDISAWTLEAGRRDINNDGIIDVYEHYENGKISGIALDWNNNGKPEYLEDWSVLNIKIWDFDEDSFSDAEYLSSSDGRDYSKIPIENGIVNQYDTFSWDFSFKNFWFNNN